MITTHATITSNPCASYADRSVILCPHLLRARKATRTTTEVSCLWGYGSSISFDSYSNKIFSRTLLPAGNSSKNPTCVSKAKFPVDGPQPNGQSRRCDLGCNAPTDRSIKLPVKPQEYLEPVEDCC